MKDTRLEMQIREAVKELRKAHPELTEPQFEQARREIERAIITSDEKKKIKKFLESNPKKAGMLLDAWLKEEEDSEKDRGKQST